MTLTRRIGILGAGRAGCSLAAALGDAGHEVAVHWTRSASSAEAARAEGFQVSAGALPEALRTCSLVFLAVADGVVGRLADVLTATGALAPGVMAAHMAGSLDLTPLEPLRRAGHPVGSLHPLLSLASRRSSIRGGTAAIDSSDSELDSTLVTLAQAVGLHVIRPAGDRARYHAAACLVGNYPQMLMEAGVRLLRAGGLDESQARQALAPLLESATRNAAQWPAIDALTGPVARGDVDTVRRHLAALDALPDTALVDALYRAGARLASDVVRERHPTASALIDTLLVSDVVVEPDP